MGRSPEQLSVDLGGDIFDRRARILASDDGRILHPLRTPEMLPHNKIFEGHASYVLPSSIPILIILNLEHCQRYGYLLCVHLRHGARASLSLSEFLFSGQVR